MPREGRASDKREIGENKGIFVGELFRWRVTLYPFWWFQENNSADVEKALKEWNNEVENMLLTLVSSFNEELRDTYFSTTVEQVNPPGRLLF